MCASEQVAGTRAHRLLIRQLQKLLKLGLVKSVLLCKHKRRIAA